MSRKLKATIIARHSALMLPKGRKVSLRLFFLTLSKTSHIAFDSPGQHHFLQIIGSISSKFHHPMAFFPPFFAVLALSLFFTPYVAGAHDANPNYQIERVASNPRFQTSALAPDYSRYPQVERACQHILSSSSSLNIEARQVQSLIQQLSFLKGDWQQPPGGASLMPLLTGDPINVDPVRLVSFELTTIDGARHSSTAINVTGTLAIGISINGTSPADGQRYLAPLCRLSPGSSELGILFQGVYTESKNNGGEIVLCLLGDALLPSRVPSSSDPWKNAKDSPFLQDDKVLLVLRYPKIFSLTSRAVRGEMSSLQQKSSLNYFDNITISSQLGAFSNYHYGSQFLVSKACSPYPFKDDLVNVQLDLYKGMEFCEVLDRITIRETLTVSLPTWSCNLTNDDCMKKKKKELGPFQFHHKSIRSSFLDGGKFVLLMQDVRCDPKIEWNNASSARVSAVFRLVHPWENQYTSAERSGLDGTTLVAEGIWSSTSGQLCMVGCLGISGSNCDSRICLYFPVSFSIKQRSVLLGRITSIGEKTSFLPLSFGREAHPLEVRNKFSGGYTSYKYTQIEQAGALLERNEPFDFGTVIKKSFLSYPKLNSENDELVALLGLADDLTFHVFSAPDPLLPPQVHTPRIFVQFEILSLGSMLGRHWSSRKSTLVAENNKEDEEEEVVLTEKQILLNLSAELTISSEAYSNISLIFLEGLYNPVDGRMYLIGCRNLRDSPKLLSDNPEVENGLDCLVEVIVEYPPTTARWLMNPTANILISSRRNEDDPLHFRSPIKLQTFLILYRKQRADLLSQRNVEAVLRILTLSLAIVCILSQLFYIRGNAASVPYISLFMLGVQALGYSIPLITGAEALFARLTSESYQNQSSDLDKNLGFQMLDYLVKILVLGAFLLTLRLGQKVWKSRIRLLTRSPLEPGRVPNDKCVFLICTVMHLAGFLVVLILHTINVAKRPIQPEKYINPVGNAHKLNEWVVKLEEYVGLAQDFFLLPQIVGNFLWQLNSKPLKKVYYTGITLVRILPHFYDYIRAPVFNPYFADQHEFVNPTLDFYSKFGDVAIPVTATFLAVVVYIQQRWGYNRIGQSFKTGKKTLLPLGSRVYERLPSMSKVEAELVSCANQVPWRKNENPDS